MCQPVSKSWFVQGPSPCFALSVWSAGLTSFRRKSSWDRRHGTSRARCRGADGGLERQTAVSPLAISLRCLWEDHTGSSLQVPGDTEPIEHDPVVRCQHCEDTRQYLDKDCFLAPLSAAGSSDKSGTVAVVAGLIAAVMLTESWIVRRSNTQGIPTFRFLFGDTPRSGTIYRPWCGKDTSQKHPPCQ
jgi:hypothetical protein